MYRIESRTTQNRAPQLPQTYRNTNPHVSRSTGVTHITNVSRPQTRNTQIKDKVMPNIIQVKYKKTEVEDHHRISSITNQTKSVTACNDSLKSRTSNVNAVCATCGKRVFNSNHDACVFKFLNDVNARTKKPNVVPISTRKPKRQANKPVATPRKKTVGSDPTITNFKSYYRMLYEKTSNAWKWWIAQQCPSGYKWVPKTKMKWVPKDRNEIGKKRVTFAIDNVSKITNVASIRNLQSPVISVRTDRGTEFLNKTLNAFFKEEGIEHQTSTSRTPEQNDIVKRRNCTLVDAARTMLSASKLPMFFWAEAIATACYTQNRSIIIPTHKKIAYHIINDRKPSIKHLHIFGCTCYLTKDGENLDKMKDKGDPYILVGYSTQSKGYRVYNKRTRLIVESIHVKFDEIKEMSETSVANDTSGLVP
ncbi:retrovirus-related pol polyprotein from transposon TNT 1-94 [Tanacetum coccineum]|uniref:Retrovirus-related pol polyprotein from transposon TNT 1-94 n=1 Tax=Tanacetum coccineum TaxID=301880 RepID=A0ABQ5EX60_9ASTR